MEPRPKEAVGPLMRVSITREDILRPISNRPLAGETACPTSLTNCVPQERLPVHTQSHLRTLSRCETQGYQAVTMADRLPYRVLK